MKKESNISGILIVDKPKDYTSRDVVNKVSNILGTKKIGHTGTLDPLATGVLVLVIGKYTKLAEALTSKYKEYVAEMEFGYETDTLDITGTVERESNIMPTIKAIEEVISSFIGSYTQEVPKYSAVKVDGKRLYDYARSNKEIKLPIREVEIRNLDILSCDDKEVKFKTTVSKGTYIRSLIRDIGRKIGCYATMKDLRRTKQGNFSIENAYTLEEIEKGNFRLLSLEDAIDDMLIVECDEKIFKEVSNGVQQKLDTLKEYILFRRNGEDIALYRKKGDLYKMYIKF